MGEVFSVMAQPSGLVVLLHQPAPCMDSGEQLSQGSWPQRRRAQGSLTALGSAINPVPASVKGQL